jgi:hypothetical protein
MPQVRLGARLGPACLLTVALVAPARAATWRVVHDPANPVDQVGSAAMAAADGDSILVGPGIYYEHVPIVGKSLTFVSSDGADQTILDGSRAIPGREGSIFYDPSVTTAPLVIEGFTLRGGTGQLSQGGSLGGAVSWYNRYELPGKSLLMRSCALEANHLEHGEGDAIFCHYMETVRLESCTFRDNSGSTAAEVYVSGGDIILSDCTFQIPEQWRVGVVWCPGATQVKVLDCLFESNGGGNCSLFFDNVESTLLLRNRFLDRGSSPTATNVHISDLAFEPLHQTIVMTGNLFWFSAGPDSGGPSTVQVTAMRQQMDVQNNTFVRCGLTAGAGGGTPNLYANNIFYRSTVRLSGSIGGQVRCNDAWPLAIYTDVPDIYAFADNIEADPLFCAEGSGDFHVAVGGPCDQTGSPPGCNLIGALEANCHATPVERTSWGRLKARFR